MSADQYLPKVGTENRRVQAIAFESPAQIKGTAAAQDCADYRHIEIDAGGDVRQAQPLVVDDVTQQQVIEMTPVAGHVYDFVVAGYVMQPVDMRQLNSIVNPVPHPTEKTLHDPDRRIGYMRCNFLGVLARFLRGPFPLGAAVAGFCIDRGAHAGIMHHHIHQRAAV